MSHRSFVSRTVMPASEYEMSSPSLLDFVRPVVVAAGLRRQFLQQFAILFQMEILGRRRLRGGTSPRRGPVPAARACAVTSATYEPGLSGVPIGRVDALLQRIGMQFDGLRARHPDPGCAPPPGRRWSADKLCRELPRADARGRRRTALACGVDATTRVGVSLTSQRSSCRQNISWLMSSTGCSICQRQSPPVANTAVRPRPYFSVISSGSVLARQRSCRPAPARRAWAARPPENSSGTAASSSARHSRRDFLRCA